jgi:cytosine/adenosine deaminase-related metal-dependent hydrolase
VTDPLGATLLQGACVLSLDSAVGNHASADVLIEDGRIREVGQGLRARNAEVIDAENAIVMPGFVDAHRHLARTLYRNTGDLALRIDFEEVSPEEVYAATLLGLWSAVEAGTTTVVDWSDARTPAQLEAAVQAHAEAGVRTVLATALDAPDVPAHTTLALASPELASGGETIAAAWAGARTSGRAIHAHAGRERSDAGAVAEIGRRNLLGADVTLVHGTHLSDGDLDAVAAGRASMVLTPCADMAGPLGAPPIQQILDRKIPVGLGVDDERSAPGDMFAQMRSLISVQHATYFDLKLAGKAGLPNLLTTRELIRQATIGGARLIGLGDHTGSLTPGKAADLVVFETDRVNIYPINDPIGTVVWGLDTSNVSWVFVGGRAVVREGRVQADTANARALASEAQQRMTASTGTAGTRETQ